MSNIFEKFREKLGYTKEERALNKYLDEAANYFKNEGNENPSFSELCGIVEILMKNDGIDLSKIRTGDQKLPDNL